jgi:hypothetical protein
MTAKAMLQRRNTALGEWQVRAGFDDAAALIQRAECRPFRERETVERSLEKQTF